MGYGECARDHGREMAKRVWQLGLENHRRIREQLEEYDIDCDYLHAGSTTLIRRDLPGWEADLATARKDAEDLRQDGFDVDLLDENAATEAGHGPAGLYAGALRHNADAQFHSGKYVIGLAEGIAALAKVNLCEGLRVRQISVRSQGVRVETDTFPIDASVAILATNALIPQFVPSLERAMRAERGQVLVTEPLPDRPCTGSFGSRRAWWREVILPGRRFRLLFGGGRDRDEPDSLFPQYRPDGSPHPLLESGGFFSSQAHQDRLDFQFKLLFPQYRDAAITHRWGGLQSFTADGFPIVGCLDEERRIYGIGGFSGHGNCYSDVAAEYLAGKLAGSRSPIEESFGTVIEELMAPASPGREMGRVEISLTPRSVNSSNRHRAEKGDNGQQLVALSGPVELGGKQLLLGFQDP